MRSLKFSIFLCFVMSGIVFSSCSSNVEDPQIFTDVPAILKWGGSPALDGTGILLIMDAEPDKNYGIPGTKEDYTHLFCENNKAGVIADFELTGKNVIRGWGSTFPEANILKIQLRD